MESVAGYGDFQRRAHRPHALVAQQTEPLYQKSNRNVLQRVQIDGRDSGYRVVSGFENDFAGNAPDIRRARRHDGHPSHCHSRIPRQHYDRPNPDMRGLPPPDFTPPRRRTQYRPSLSAINCRSPIQRVSGMKRGQASPLVRLIERHTVVRSVGSIYLSLPVAVDQRRKSGINHRGVVRPIPNATRSIKELRVDRGAQAWSSHATNIAYIAGRYRPLRCTGETVDGRPNAARLRVMRCGTVRSLGTGNGTRTHTPLRAPESPTESRLGHPPRALPPIIHGWGFGG